MKILGLTAQQFRVAELIADEKTDKEIADELQIGRPALRFHVRRIAEVLGVTGKNFHVAIARRIWDLRRNVAA